MSEELVMKAAQAIGSATIYPPLATRDTIIPYPEDRPESWRLRDGTPVTIRPLRADDAPRIECFLLSLSEYYEREAVFNDRCWENGKSALDDPYHHYCLIALRRDPRGQNEIVALARLRDIAGGTGAGFAVLVADRCRFQGLGTELLQRLVQAARVARRQTLSAEILPDDHGMQRMCITAGCRLRFDPQTRMVHAHLTLALKEQL